MSFKNEISNHNNKNITESFSTVTAKDHNKVRICPGKSCTNEGIHPLRILFINRLAYFCDYHKEKFTSLKIVEPVVEKEANTA